jgi:hypothetical protein
MNSIRSFSENYITGCFNDGKPSYSKDDISVEMQLGPYEIYRAKKVVDDVLNELNG